MDSGLYRALVKGNLALLEQSEFDFFQKTSVANTTLHVAVQSEILACVKLILGRCPSLLRCVNLMGDTALHIAARQGLYDIAELLIEHEKLVRVTTVEGGETEASELLLVRIFNEENDTALHEALRNHHHEVVSLLLEADPEFEYSANKAGETPLYLAAESGSTEMVKQILQICPSCPHGGPRGISALHAAILNDSSEIIQLLRDNKPDIIQETTETGQTPLHYAVQLSLEERVIDLLEWDSSIAYVSDDIGRLALHIAAYKGLAGIVHRMKVYCPDSWELLDGTGLNFVHWATQQAQIDVIHYVLREKNMVADILNESDNFGNTPLHYAVMFNSFIAIDLMEEDIVNKRIVNQFNNTPLDIATKVKAAPNPVMVAHLRKVGGVNNLRDLPNNFKVTLDEVEKVSWFDESLRYSRENICNDLVVAILMATVSFTGGLTVPGGFKSNGPNEGMATLAKKASFKVFVVSNTVAMLLSTYAIFLHFNVRLLNKKHLMIKYLERATKCISHSMLAMTVTFMTALYAVLPYSTGLGITVCLMCSLFVVSCYWFLLRIYSKTVLLK